MALKSMQGIRDLFKVSAQTVELGAKLHYTGRSSKYVDHFMQRVRIGTTRPGSYIFDARVPIMAAGEPTLDPSLNGELNGRTVMTRLYEATRAAHSAAGEAVERRMFDRFVEAVPIGVSSDLCAALGTLGGGARNCCPFDVEFTWAHADADDLRPLTVSFDSPRIGAVISAAKVLVEVFRSGRATVTGLVDMLSSSGDELRVRIRGDLEMGSGSNGIDAVVADGSEDADRDSGGHNAPATPVGTVWVALSPEQYQAAIDAHRDKRQLEVHGRLIPDSPRLQIAPDRSGFRVL
ncbi:hypothetical protein ACQP1G_00765 [Nocardia sp. CA-107356]|uniref:hypothetical protein n=1 Tax=Nocardia sp. CA-107356 TaxID=3239972 RepID=UPI003D93DD71